MEHLARNTNETFTFVILMTPPTFIRIGTEKNNTAKLANHC